MSGTQMTAPVLDNLIDRAKSAETVLHEKTKALVRLLYEKLQVIRIGGEDERREFWFTVPRGTYHRRIADGVQADG